MKFLFGPGNSGTLWLLSLSLGSTLEAMAATEEEVDRPLLKDDPDSEAALDEYPLNDIINGIGNG